MREVYINSFGAFLPGDPVVNSEMEEYLGLIGGKKSRHRALVLRQNKIKTRHYALDKSGAARYGSAEMAAEAVRAAVEKSENTAEDITYLAASATLGDMLVPGLASHIHAELGLRPIEIANFQSVCASAMMAMKSAWLQIRAEEHDCAAVCGSEFSSRYFRPGFYEKSRAFLENGEIPLEADFLRFTLSDGAGAAILENRPNAGGVSFKILWIDIRSYAGRFQPCMTAGIAEEKYWSAFATPLVAAEEGALMLVQDFDLLKKMIPVWISHYLDLIDAGKIDPEATDYLCSHYSSHSLREEAVSLLEKTGALIEENRWFSNLSQKGNTGAASIFIILEELARTKKLKTGQRILCHVPESGRCLNGFMMLEVV
ncbi:MAG: StlD/DarB family beta-ketosynthase [Micavibrio sp.]|nr:MAG: StlD/DarB family beta-ketosynthase [Micavibrio sp.]